MHHSYHDITSRISEPPKWWDENGDWVRDKALEIPLDTIYTIYEG